MRSLSSLLFELAPVGVALALSPFPAIAVMLIVVSPRGVLSAACFVAGRITAIIGATALVAGVGELAGGGSGSAWVSWLKIAAGAVLMLFALVKLRSARRRTAPPELPGWMSALERMSPPRCAGAGLALTVANPKEWAFMATAGLMLSSAGVSRTQELAAGLWFLLLASSTAIAPVIAMAIAPGRARTPLLAARDWLVRTYPLLIAAVLFLLGLSILIDGLIKL